MNKKYENKILLVDDDTKNLQVAMNILKNYNVIYAQSGEKALELLEKNSFDLILLDVVMPVMDGYNVCSKIKSNDKTKKIPVIFLTVKDDEKDIVKGFELGAVDYVTKPFYSEVLLKRVELHLKLATAMNEIEQMNLTLNERVQEQIKQIREKDEIIIQNSKINAIASVIDILALQWKKPLDKIKLYLQSLDFKISNIDELKTNDIFDNTMKQVNKLDEIMYDFHKFFSHENYKEDVNIKVSLDNAIFSLKDELKGLNIDLKIEGDNLLSLNIVNDEIKHIFTKLINQSIENFKVNSNLENRYIHVNMESVNDSIFISYLNNSKIYDEVSIEKLFLAPNSLSNENFDLGYYLVKVFIEKNFGLLMVRKTEDGIKYIIRFDK